jgi:quercetin dioxygenase-like cupin family protein
MTKRDTIQALGSEITFLHHEPGQWALMQVGAPRGVGAPPHAHDFGESYYVLSGSLWLTVDGREMVLGPGEFFHIPGGAVHGFRATSDEPAQLLIHQAPGDAVEFFRACAREIKLPADMPRVRELSARYGIRPAPLDCARPSGADDGQKNLGA